MSRIEELEKQAKSILEEIEKLKKEEKEESKVWKPKDDEEYYFLNGNDEVVCDNWENHIVDVNRYETGNCFKTGEEAERLSEKAKIYTQLKRLAEEINTEPIDWENREQTKYYIAYECHPDEHGLRECYTLTLKIAGVIYCTNGNFLKIAKARIGEENLLKLFKE